MFYIPGLYNLVYKCTVGKIALEIELPSTGKCKNENTHTTPFDSSVENLVY